MLENIHLDVIKITISLHLYDTFLQKLVFNCNCLLTNNEVIAA